MSDCLIASKEKRPHHVTPQDSLLLWWGISQEKAGQRDKMWVCWPEHNTVVQICLQSHTYHIIQVTNTIVASLNELKKRIRSSPSWPSFFSATPKTRANSTSPRMFIPSISVPTGICRDKTRRLVTCENSTKLNKRVTSFCCCLIDLKSTSRTYFGKEEPILLEGIKEIWTQFRYNLPSYELAWIHWRRKGPATTSPCALQYNTCVLSDLNRQTPIYSWLWCNDDTKVKTPRKQPILQSRKEERKAEKGSPLWQPTPSSVHVSCGRQRTEDIPVPLLRNHVTAWEKWEDKKQDPPIDKN